tara:strand:- start:16 stop:723 length:708 start_codon:yes stop_codon:yes gene_type:complete
MKNFSIVIPVYNEEKNIKFLIEEIYYFLEPYSDLFEVIVVNDASTDNTNKIINNLILKFKSLKLLNNKINIGQSYSIKNGINTSIYDTIVTMDGDGQNNPKDIFKLLEKYFSDENIFLVGGIRRHRKDSYLKKISSKIANKVRKYILRDNCDDTGCSLKVLDKKVFMSLDFFNGVHRFLPALYNIYGKKTVFMNVDHRFRLHGNSNYGTIDRLIRGVKDIIKVIKIRNKINKIND